MGDGGIKRSALTNETPVGVADFPRPVTSTGSNSPCG